IADLSSEDRKFFENLRVPVNPELGTLYRTIQKKKPVYLEFRKTRTPEALIDRLVVEQLKMTSVVQIPVVVGEKVLGVATIDPGEKRLKRTEIPRLEAVVAQISGAVQKQLLLEKVETEKREAQELRVLAEREKEESELLAELAREINRGATIEELLLPVARVSRERLGTSSLALYLEDEKQDLVLKAGFYQDRVDDPTKYPDVVQRIPLDSAGSSLPRVYFRKRASFVPRVNAALLKNFEIDDALYQFWKYEWVALLPLLLKGESIGLIAWSGPASDRISRSDVPLLERVADLITGAVENLNLLEKIREEKLASEQERQNSQVLAALSRKAIEGDDLNTITEGIYEPIKDLVGQCGIALYLPDPDHKSLEHRCVLGPDGFLPLEELPASIRDFPLEQESGSLYWSFHKARSWFMPVIRQSRVNMSPVDREIQAFFKFSWCYHIPLVVSDEVIGIVTLAGTESVALTKQDRQFLERIVGQVAGAIRMQQLLSSVEQERNVAARLQRESRALADFTRLLNQRADLKSIVLEVCRFAVESLGLRGSYIMLVNDAEKEFQSIGGYGTDYGEQQVLFVEASRIPMDPEAGVHYGTYKRKKTVYLPRIPDKPDEFDGFLAQLFDLKSFALVPLMLDERVIGIMGVDPGQKRLVREDLRKLETYADHVAGAINNGNLLKQVEDQRSSIEGLAEITQTAASTDNLEEILDQIFAYVYRRFGIASGIVLLPDGNGKNLLSYKAFSMEDMEKLNLWDAFEYAQSMRLATDEEGGTLARTFARGKPFYVPDTARLAAIKRDYPGAEKDREILEHLNYRGYFALPMQVHGEPVALMIFTAYTEAFKLAPRDREELRTLADQLAGIIRSRQLAASLDFEKQQVEKEKADSQVLANLARQANEGSDIQSILKEMAAYADSECGVKRLGLWLVEPETRRIYLHSIFHSEMPQDLSAAPVEIRSLPPGPEGGSVASVVERNRKMYLPRMQQEFLEASPRDAAIQEYFGFDWLLHLPLSMEGSVLGIISFVGDSDRRPSVRERLLLERMSSQVAGAIQSKQLVAEIQAERFDSDALAEVARRANEEPGISEIMDVILKYAGEQCGVDTLCLLLVSADGKTLSPRAAIRQGQSMDPESVPDVLREFSLSPETGTLYRVLERKESLYYSRITAGMERRMSDVDRAIRDYLGFHWFIDVPVMVHGQVLGALAFAGPERSKLSNREQNFLKRLTAQVSGAIYSKKLLDQVEKEKDTARKLQKETEGLNRLLKRIAPIEDLDEIMSEVLEYLQGAYGITLYSLYRADHESQLLHPISVRFPDYLSDEDRKHIEATPISFGEEAAGAFTMACRRSPRYTYYKGSRLKTPGLPEIERFVIDRCKLEMMITFPLMDGDQMAAILNLSTTSEIEFSNDQLDQLSILAESISGIIRMNGLIQDVREQSKRAEEARKETDVLAALSKQANEATDLGQVSQGLFDYLRTAMELEDFALFVVDPDSSEVFAAAWDTRRELGEAGEWLKSVRLKLEPDLGTLYRTYQKKKTTYIPRFVEGFSSPGDNLIVEKLQLTSVLQVPLTIHDEVIGFFVCGPRRTLRLSREEIRTIERFCNQVAGAVRATALLETSRRAQETAEAARTETEALANLSRQANETTNLATLSQGVFDVLRLSLGLDNQGLFIVDDKETELIPVHLDETTGRKWDQGFRVPLNHTGGTLHKTWQRKKSTYLPRLPLDGAAEPDLEIVRQLGITAVLQIPLVVSDRVVAIFACGPTRHLSREEIRSAERYCQQIAGAVRVMALLQATQEAREEAVA
ncbi:MAG: GAF domain-containing protein, partial [Leptospiraceae bacterium]|nr:GAF domain-containing protein [Leptospiraceae bacterium]